MKKFFVTIILFETCKNKIFFATFLQKCFFLKGANWVFVILILHDTVIKSILFHCFMSVHNNRNNNIDPTFNGEVVIIKI